MNRQQLLALGFGPVARQPCHASSRWALARAPELGPVTALAARLLEAPCGLLLLAEAHGDWLLASYGLPHGAPRLLEGGWLAERTAAAARGLWLEDLTREIDFAGHPLVVREPYLRAYAGAALRSADGAWVGALAVMDHRPRALGAGKATLLELLARQASARLRLLGQAHHPEEPGDPLAGGPGRDRGPGDAGGLEPLGGGVARTRGPGPTGGAS